MWYLRVSFMGLSSTSWTLCPSTLLPSTWVLPKALCSHPSQGIVCPLLPSYTASKPIFFLYSFAAARFWEHFTLNEEPHNSLLLLRPPEVFVLYSSEWEMREKQCSREGTLSPRTSVLPWKEPERQAWRKGKISRGKKGVGFPNLPTASLFFAWEDEPWF